MIKVNGENFVVTGGGGFIGSHIVEEIVNQGKRVVVFDNGDGQCLLSACGGKIQYAGWDDDEAKPIRYYDYDITDENDPFYGECFAAAMDKPDIVFHEACSKCTVCREDPLKDLMTNAWGSFQVFDAARKDGAKVVHASTGSVYGNNTSLRALAFCKGGIMPRDFVTCEFGHYEPISFYGVSKLAGEQYLRAFKEYYGLRFVGLRYFHVFGPRQDSGPNGGVTAIFITKMLKGEPLTIYGDGKQTRSFTYVKDVVAANFHAANSTEMEGEYYNVASGVSISLNELVETLSEIMDVKPKVEYLPVRKGDIKYFNVSNQKIAQAGYGQWTDFKDALQETVGWYRDNS